MALGSKSLRAKVKMSHRNGVLELRCKDGAKWWPEGPGDNDDQV